MTAPCYSLRVVISFGLGRLTSFFPGYDPEFGQGDHMFNDLALSREVLREFHNRIPETSSARKLSVMVLQRSVWPFAARKRDVDLHPSVRSLPPSSSFR